MSNLFKTPKAPDPYATASAAAAQNRDTAVASQELNMVNQYTPDGTLEYSQAGTTASGTPRYQAVQTLSAAGQAIKNQQDQFDRMSNQTAIDQLGRIQTKLSTPLSLGNEATEARLMQLGSARLDPRFAQEDQRLEQSLMDRGIRPGSDAYNTMRRQFTEGKNDAYNQLLLTGRQQANSELIQERQQPINEMTALLNGQQLATPQYVNAPQTQVAGVDLAGLINSNYQTKAANQQAMMGGLFGLGGAAAGAAGSYFKPRT